MHAVPKTQDECRCLFAAMHDRKTHRVTAIDQRVTGANQPFAGFNH